MCTTTIKADISFKPNLDCLVGYHNGRKLGKVIKNMYSKRVKNFDLLIVHFNSCIETASMYWGQGFLSCFTSNERKKIIIENMQLANCFAEYSINGVSLKEKIKDFFSVSRIEPTVTLFKIDID